MCRRLDEAVRSERNENGRQGKDMRSIGCGEWIFDDDGLSKVDRVKPCWIYCSGRGEGVYAVARRRGRGGEKEKEKENGLCSCLSDTYLVG